MIICWIKKAKRKAALRYLLDGFDEQGAPFGLRTSALKDYAVGPLQVRLQDYGREIKAGLRSLQENKATGPKAVRLV